MFNRIKQKIFPQGLYWRALLILLLPLFLLQGVLAYVFMERHFDKVTRSLSASLTNQIAAIIDWDEITSGAQSQLIESIAASKLNLNIAFANNSPAVTLSNGYKSSNEYLDAILSREIAEQIQRPYSLDTTSNGNQIEILIQLNNNRTLQVLARRSQAYAANAHIFLVWMVGTAFMLSVIAILFLRNQIRPIEALAQAAEAFGRGLEVGNFRPRGAREVRRAGNAFLRMKSRIERQMEQRTNMFNGISHDLRTVLTRFQLQLTFLPTSNDVEALKRDTLDMQHMLEAYLAFARGDAGERAEPIDLYEFLDGIVQESCRGGFDIILKPMQNYSVVIRPQAMKRCLHNLITNAARFAQHIEISVEMAENDIFIHLDDNGPGIPVSKRMDVMKPFYKIEGHDTSDEGGTGLGLAIAQDIATSHGGDLVLSESALGGLRVTVRVPS